MALPNSYTLKPGAIPAYFEAMLEADAPDRFTTRFLENLGFKSTNDRMFINVLKELGFLDTDGVPTARYYEFLDRSQSQKIVAEGIRSAYSDLFAINRNAQRMSVDDIKNKLRTLYQGTKKDGVVTRIASTFSALCEYADFSPRKNAPQPSATSTDDAMPPQPDKGQQATQGNTETAETPPSKITLDSMQYHINIILPESRDQSVYDAIFKSLKEHLG